MSIVVPNYNGAATLGPTLQSLLDQQYPHLEILVVDGGSADASVEVIRQYQPHLAWWVSEKDRGQSHAINKGFAHCTGEVVNWLCSDDRLHPGALRAVGEAFAAHPEADVVVGAGEAVFVDQRRSHLPPFVNRPTPERLALMPCVVAVAQPACFYRRRLLDRPTPVREDLYYLMDLELWTYFNQQQARWLCLPQLLSTAREGEQNKTSTGGVRIAREMARIYRQYFPERISLMFWQRYLRNPLQCFIQRHPRHRLTWRLERLQQRLDRLLGRFYPSQRVAALDWRWYYQQ
jgi:glycosyltransferase involved in cell wall biosynthesis